MRYRIYDLSVRAMLNYSKPDGLFYKTVIDKNALRSCLKHSAHEQEDNALFYQIMSLADIADDSGTFHAIARNTRFATNARGCLTADIPHLSIRRVVTNDIVSIVSPTEFRWQGRADNIINSAGLKICPEELEHTLASLLPDGLTFYIVGVPDTQWGSAVAIVFEGTADLIPMVRNAIARINDRRQRPRYIYAEARLRRTASGKIIRDIPPHHGLRPSFP